MAMLAEKIDVTAFLTWFLPNYQESREVMREDPENQKRFISKAGSAPAIHN